MLKLFGLLLTSSSALTGLIAGFQFGNWPVVAGAAVFFFVGMKAMISN